jgi:ribosome maturation factor RimP
LVDVKGSIGGKQKVSIYLDGDQGVSIEKCSKVSRQLAAKLEEEEFFDNPYTLEVSSYGVGKPLLLQRQYSNNIGRTLQVHLSNEEKVLEGKLVQVDESVITLEKTEKKKVVKTEIEKENISKSLVMVSFN